MGDDGIVVSRGDSGAGPMLAVCMVSADATEAMLGISGIIPSSPPSSTTVLPGDDDEAVVTLPPEPPARSHDILMQYSFSRPFLVLVDDLLPAAPAPPSTLLLTLPGDRVAPAPPTPPYANRLVTGCRSRAASSDAPTWTCWRCSSPLLPAVSISCPAAMEYVV